MVILEGDNGVPLNYRSESLKCASTGLKRNYKRRRYKFRLYPGVTRVHRLSAELGTLFFVIRHDRSDLLRLLGAECLLIEIKFRDVWE